jgi:hypothetical protein
MPDNFMKTVASRFYKLLLLRNYSDLGPRDTREPTSKSMAMTLRVLQSMNRRGAYWDTFIQGENAWDISSCPRIRMLRRLLSLAVKKAAFYY